MVGNLTVHVGKGVRLYHQSHKCISKNPAFGVSSKGCQNQQKPRIPAKASVRLVSLILLSMEKCPVQSPQYSRQAAVLLGIPNPVPVRDADTTQRQLKRVYIDTEICETKTINSS